MAYDTPLFVPKTITPYKAGVPLRTVIPATLKNPLYMWSDYAYENDCFALPFAGRTFGTVMSPALVKQVLIDDYDCFEKSFIYERLLKPALGDGLLTTEGKVWRQQRRAAAPAFRHDKLVGLVPAMTLAGDDVVKRLEAHLDAGGQKLDIADEMVRATYDVIAQTLFSDAGDDPLYSVDQLADDIKLLINTVGKFNILDMFDAPSWIPRALVNPAIFKGQAAIKRLREFCERQITKRRNLDDPGDDLLGLLMKARAPETGEKLSDLELRDNVLTFVGAGHETTAVTLSWAISILSQMPALQDDLYAEVQSVCGTNDLQEGHLEALELHERVIMEVLRLFPAVAALPRNVIKTVNIGPYTFEPGDHLNVSIYPLHRHQKLWDNPNAFDPNRFTPEKNKARDRFAYLPFGGGQRICIGMKFAMMEAVAILATLMRHYKFTKAGPAPTPQMVLTVRPKGGVHVGMTRRS